MEKIVVGLVEKVKINGREVLAKIDTGAHCNSVCKELANKLKLGPVIGKMSVKSATGKQTRPVIHAELEIKGRKLKTRFNIADRKHLKYQALIGLDVLKHGFLVDVSK